VNGATTLRGRLKQRRIVIAPGAADALTAKLIARAGAEAVYFTGAGFANAQLGVPDIGLVTMSETVQQVGRIVDAVDVPVIADADTGYGGALNVQRTVRALSRAGAAAVQIEDQEFPKRCGHFDGKEIVSVSEMVARIRAARDAADGSDLVVIGRTDARAVEGLEAALERGVAYARAGADLIFVEAPLTRAEIRAIPVALPVPAVINFVEGGKTPILPRAELERLGFRVAIYANTALRVAAKSVRDAMAHLVRTGSSRGLEEDMLSWSERQELVGLEEFERLDRRLASGPQSRRAGRSTRR